MCDQIEQRLALARQDRREEAALDGLVGQPEHFADFVGGDGGPIFTAAVQIGMRDRLVEDR